jgi:hypothetical protein
MTVTPPRTTRLATGRPIRPRHRSASRRARGSAPGTSLVPKGTSCRSARREPSTVSMDQIWTWGGGGAAASLAPILLGLALDRWRRRVLDLDPVVGAPRNVARTDSTWRGDRGSGKGDFWRSGPSTHNEVITALLVTGDMERQASVVPPPASEREPRRCCLSRPPNHDI